MLRRISCRCTEGEDISDSSLIVAADASLPRRRDWRRLVHISPDKPSQYHSSWNLFLYRDQRDGAMVVCSLDTFSEHPVPFVSKGFSGLCTTSILSILQTYQVLYIRWKRHQ
jgi:hypothetical protein